MFRRRLAAQPAGVSFDRLGAGPHLAGVLGGLELGQQLAQLRSLGDAQLRCKPSPRISGAGGPSRRQSSAAASIRRARSR